MMLAKFMQRRIKVSSIYDVIYQQKSSYSTRNIGILAHIDAGKTTTTERMLFYSGRTRALGEVHHGNTVTDYLTQERERGITICSSAVTFSWNGFRINLLDTPGHIDFTMEVEQSLFAVDGVVVVLDGSAGVEAQTITVWNQADRHQLPRIIFANKMDRPDSNFEACLVDINKKLGVDTLHLQWPLKEKNQLTGIIDLINLKKIVWSPNTLGREYLSTRINESMHEDIIKERNKLIDKLCDLDDELADIVINSGGYDKIPAKCIISSIKKATCTQRITPVLLGSAYKNIGIQPLMDAVTQFLPAPDERNQLYDCFGQDFAARVFKIVHDKQRGPLTLVRVLRGSMKKGMRVVTPKGSSEVLQKIYEPLADEYREITSVDAGNVAVCSGLKNTVTGDLLITSISSIKSAQNKLEKMIGGTKNDREDQNDLQLIYDMLSLQPQIPDAVYFCSIEPPSLSQQSALENALRQLQREDPSLRVHFNEETGQTVLGGMGELHVDVIKSRILTEYKIEADLGPFQIAYKEIIDSEYQDTLSVEKEIAGSRQQVTITLSLLKNGKTNFSLDTSPENMANLSSLRPRVIQAIKKGALNALERGPRVGGQVVHTQVKLHNLTIGRGTAESFLIAAAAQCVQKILDQTGTRLLEPIMSMQILAPTERISTILGDLGRRRAVINDVIPKGEQNKIIFVNAPLAELSGYSSVLRTLSSGTAAMTMQPSGYSSMNSQDEQIAVRRAQGLE